MKLKTTFLLWLLFFSMSAIATNSMLVSHSLMASAKTEPAESSFDIDGDATTYDVRLRGPPYGWHRKSLIKIKNYKLKLNININILILILIFIKYKIIIIKNIKYNIILIYYLNPVNTKILIVPGRICTRVWGDKARRHSARYSLT